MLSALASYALFQRTAAAPAPQAPLADPAMQAEIDYWRKTAPQTRSLLAFVDDPRLVAFAAKAFGFGDTPPNKGILSIALEQGAADPSDYVNRAPDYRLEAMVRSLGFAEFGTARLQDSVFVESVVTRFTAQSTAAAETPQPDSPKEAYFKNKIGSVRSAAELVADLGLYEVALTAFGLEDRAGERFLIQTALQEGIGQETDLANRLGDPRLQAMAGMFGFGEVGTSNVRDADFGETVIRRYRQALGQAEVRLAESETSESRYFRETIGSIGSAEELLADPRLYSYVMTAFDLSGQAERRGIAARVLGEGASGEGALAGRLGDPRWAEMARSLGFAEFGARNVQDQGIIDEIVGRYERVRQEVEIGFENPAAELAAYFDRKTEGELRWIDIVADSRLRRVAMTALGMPPAMAAFGSARLVAEFESRFDIADLSEPRAKDAFIKRYLVLSEAGTGSGAFDPVLTLFAGAGGPQDDLYSLVSRL